MLGSLRILNISRIINLFIQLTRDYLHCLFEPNIQIDNCNFGEKSINKLKIKYTHDTLSSCDSHPGHVSWLVYLGITSCTPQGKYTPEVRK